MNFLAHAWLAGDSTADRVGGVIGDFVKGPLPAGLPSDLAAGVALHRKIDVFADTHPAFQRSRARVSLARRRFAGVLVDMFYDHLLARDWPRYDGQALPQFAADIYQEMATCSQALPTAAREIARPMAADDWLTAYADITAVERALQRMSRHRLRRANPLGGAIEELLADYGGFTADCRQFLPDAANFAATQRAGRRS